MSKLQKVFLIIPLVLLIANIVFFINGQMSSTSLLLNSLVMVGITLVVFASKKQAKDAS